MSHSGTALVDPYKIFDKILLSEGMRVADLGCGRTGHFVFPAAQIVGAKGIVYAVDVIKDVLESVRSMARGEGCDNVQTIWSDIERLGKTPIAESSLDVCFFVNVLFQLKDKTGAVKEASRLLKKDGFMVVVDWAKKLGFLGPSPELMLNPEKISALAAQENFKFIDRVVVGDYHYSLIFQKN